MAEERLMTVSVQLPASELGRLSELMGRILRVLDVGEAKQGPAAAPAAVEQSDSTFFDPAQFKALCEAAEQEDPALPQVYAERAADSPSAQPGAALPERLTGVPDGEEATAPRQASERAERTPREAAFFSSAGAVETPLYEQPAPDISNVSEVWDRWSPGWAGASHQKPAVPLRMEAAGSPEIHTGFPAVNAAAAPSPESSGGEARLVTAGPAPLTARAVSLAFERDDRRYDNGFPLY